MITEFLIKRYVVFVCEKCGETVSMYAPASGESNIKSYCCSARYEVEDRRGDILVERLADEERDTKRDYDGPVEVAVNSIHR